MKKTASNRTASVKAATGKLQHPNVKVEPKSAQGTPVPPSEEMIARLNAIAREYPFCVSNRVHNISLL